MSENAKEYPCPQCGKLFGPGQNSDPHNRPDGRRCVSVVIYRRRYREDDVADGAAPLDDVREDVTDCLPDPAWDDEDATVISMAADVLRKAGTDEPSSSPGFSPGLWYCNPDGSCTVDYGPGEREEPTAHLYGFTEDEQRQVWEAVTGRTAA